jgi:predicted nucleic acid-binding Zn ribbon protein
MPRPNLPRPKEQKLTEEERYLQDDYRRRRVPVQHAKSMGDIVGQLLVKRGYANVQQARTLDEVWLQAVGDRFGNQTKAGQIKRGVLEVFVSNSAVLQELTFLKAKLIKSLAQVAAEQKIRDIKFRVGSL